MPILVGVAPTTVTPVPSLPGAAAVTAQSWVDDTRLLLDSGMYEERNRLAVPYLAGQTGTLQFKYDLRGITPGSRISVGLNTFYVYAVDGGSKTATVEGGQGGSVDGDADEGATVLVRPRYTDADILRKINEDLGALSAAGLFQMLQVSFPYAARAVGYEFTNLGPVTDVYSVRYDTHDTASLAKPRIKSTDYRLERNVDTGVRLELFHGGATGRSVTMQFKAPFTPLLNLAALVSTTGLPPTAWDLPSMGAALRLVVGREIRRNDMMSQGDPRRAEEVPTGGIFGSTRGLTAQRERRVQDEIARLQSLYPVLLG